jgi:hypothetical protein
MSEIMLTVSYQSLGQILEELQNAPEIKRSAELSSQIRNAILFHQQISTELEGVLRRQLEVEQELSDLTREPGERVCHQPILDEFEKYERMRDRGAAPREVYLAAQDDGLDKIKSIKALRQIFHLSLQEAQETIAQAREGQPRYAVQ